METKTMNNKLTLGKIALGFLFASFYTACDESTTENITQVNQVGMDVVSAEKDLPECNAENEGAQAFVKGKSSARVCVDKVWIPVVSSVKDTVYVEKSDFSCKTESLADSSGLKIICNGDSIGVLKNGAKGEKGEDGGPGEPGSAGVGCSVAGQTDSTVTIACGADTTTIQLNYSKADEERESSVDFYQKGFFLRGATVYLYVLSSGSTLRQTEEFFTRDLVRDDGFYKFIASDLTGQYGMLIFDGFYRNVVTGRLSDAPIRLKLLTDVTMRSTANANPLTYLEYDRVYYLVTKEDMKVKTAKRQAKYEIMDLFSMDTTEVGFPEDISMFGTTEASAKLLALTILLQADRSEAEFKELLTEIADDISKDGKWDNPEKMKEIANWAKDADESSRLDEIREHIVKGTDIVFPDFAQYIRKFYKAELGD